MNKPSFDVKTVLDACMVNMLTERKEKFNNAISDFQKYEEEFAKEGIKIIYFPYTKGVSSTKITEALKQVRGWTSEASEAAVKSHVNIEKEES